MTLRAAALVGALLACPALSAPGAEPAPPAQDQQAAPAAPRKAHSKKKGKARTRRQAPKKKQEPAPEAAADAKPECKDMDPGLCEKDADCVCAAKGCFKGGRQYYDRCVDKEESCLDFCWTRLLDKPTVMKCTNHRCESTTAP